MPAPSSSSLSGMAVVVVVRFSVASCSSSVSSDNSESLSRPVVGWSSGMASLRGASCAGSVGGGDGDGELRDSRERVERGIAVSNDGDDDGSGADDGQSVLRTTKRIENEGGACARNTD